jgi:hypothetical protein
MLTSLLNAYFDTIEKEGYIAASQYLVNISYQQFAILKKKGLVLPREEKTYIEVVNVPYTESGLDLASTFHTKNEQEGLE